MKPADQLRQAVSRFIASRNARERKILAIGVTSLAAILIYLILLAPAIDGRANLEKSLPALRQQLAELQMLAGQASTLSGAATAPVMSMTKESIETSLSRKGLKAQSVVVTGDFAKVQLSAIPFAGLADWIDEAQRTARLSATEATITALAQPGNVDASLTLHQQKSDQ